MKKKIGGVILLLCSLFVMGCGTRSSMPEDVYALQQLPDFKEVVQSMEISGAWLSDATVDKATPAFETKDAGEIYTGHMHIYRTKSDTFRVVTMFDARPPRVTGLSKEFK